MLRRFSALLAVSTLDHALIESEFVWNLKFRGQPTTKILDFHVNFDPSSIGNGIEKEEDKKVEVVSAHMAPKIYTHPRSTPMFHVLNLGGDVVENPKMEPKESKDAASDECAAVNPVKGEADVEFINDISNITLSKETCQRMMSTMVKQHTMDRILLEAQRQGRITFYMTATGEEAAATASAAALDFEDLIYMQYREAPAVVYRGCSLKQMISQCMGNIEDVHKGRQMPIHFGWKDLNVQMVSSPLATQIPHAAGAGYSYRLENSLEQYGRKGKKPRIVCCYLGEGAASEGDFHAGLNFASVVDSHTLFFVRNNGFAISTPAAEQYNGGGDGILGRALGYNIPAIRVDGHDTLALYVATKKAREIILKLNTPVLVEAMLYRVSHHSTSDDSTAYRKKDVINHFDNLFSPIKRFENYLFICKDGWWTPQMTKELEQETTELVRSELARQESLPSWSVKSLFDDTFKVKTPNLIEQMNETLEHVKKHPKEYEKEYAKDDE